MVVELLPASVLPAWCSAITKGSTSSKFQTLGLGCIRVYFAPCLAVGFTEVLPRMGNANLRECRRAVSRILVETEILPRFTAPNTFFNANLGLQPAPAGLQIFRRYAAILGSAPSIHESRVTNHLRPLLRIYSWFLFASIGGRYLRPECLFFWTT
jgi:hypothetical protein